MAKSKDDTLKIGKKSTATQKVATVLRRSPRKPVLATKKAAADELLDANKVVKQAVAKKTLRTRKKPAKNVKKATQSSQKAASSKNATKIIRTGIKKTKSPSPSKDTTASAADVEAPKSPKRRGRAKKEAITDSTKSKSGTVDPGMISSRTRSRTPDDIAEVPMPIAEDIWTDSPRKRSPSKTSPGKAASKAKSQKHISIIDDPATARREVREFIESPADGTRGQSRASGRNASRSPSRTRSDSLSMSTGRKKSANATNSTSTARPESPAKFNSMRLSGTAIVNEDISTIFTKARSPTHGRKSRPKRLEKSPAHTTSNTSSRSPTRSPGRQTQKPRNHSRSSSIGEQFSPLRIEKTRASRSPAKSPAREPRRVRSTSPAKSLRGAIDARRSSGHTPSPVESRSRSPGKPPRQHSQSTRDSSRQATFEKRFVHNDEYGKALRRLENTAYMYSKAGQNGMAGRDPQVSREDENIAKERGIKRARLEGLLNTEAGVLPHKAQEIRRQSPARGRVPVPGLDNEPDGAIQTILSPNRARTLSNSRRSPSRAVDRTRSPALRSSKSAIDEDAPLPKGQPSAEGRGTIHSVTNPEFIPDTKGRRKNPFFETMPAQEIWHRRMPAFLSFGETPFMEREMSRQITEDLARGAEQFQSSWYSNWIPSFGKAKKSSVEQRPYKSPWALPEVSEGEVDAAMKDLQGFISEEASMGGSKRKASSQLSKSPIKRVRRRSSGNDHLMSCAL